MTAVPPDEAADLRRENARLLTELRIARDRQAAGADILRNIASASGDAERSLYQIAETTKRLFDAQSVSIQIAEGDGWRHTIRVGDTSKRIGEAVPVALLKIGGRNMPGTIVAENVQIHVPDVDNVAPEIADWPGLPPARAAGTRTLCGTPLRREGKAIGVLIVFRNQLLPFTDEELALQQSFADQAAIAFENARLFNETREALERQTATADILKVIASSPSDVQPVFDAIAASANRLIGGLSTAVFSIRDDAVHLSAFTPTGPEADAALRSSFPRPLAEQRWAQAIRDGAIFQVRDVEIEWAERPAMQEMARMRGYRSLLVVPLFHDGKAIGTINVSRAEPGEFAAHHVKLLQTFADQALIAIENTRLFNETREALERQTATADILKVIASSPSDTRPVFEAIATSANRLLGGFSAAVFRFLDGSVHLAAFTPVSPAADAALKADFPQPVDKFEGFQLAQHGRPFPIPDTEVIPHAPVREIARVHGFRSMLFVPLMNGGVPVGIISVTRRETGAFSSNYIQLLQTFGDQAVIAIENTRLFNETQEALERQTATSDILKVIASSPSDVQPVFDAIVNSAARLFEPCSATITTLKDGKLHWNAVAEIVPSFDHAAAEAVYPIDFDPDRSPSAHAILERRIIVIPDTNAADTPEYTRRVAAAGGFRNIIFVPMIHENRGIGTIILTHPQPGFRLSEKQLALIQTFADQAVIAIENARLFDEVQAKTRDLTEALTYQTGSGNILRVIASSPTNVKPVLQAIVESACELCEADDALATLKDGGDLVFQAQHGSIPVVWERQPIDRHAAAGLAVIDRMPVHVHDLLAPEGEQFPRAREFARKTNVRTVLCVPLLREGESIGAIVLRRTEVRPFSDKQITLLQTFADQAVIAIGNVRLFEEVQQRTRELAASLDNLRTAQDRLVQTEKLASLGQLTAGIAHEIKNPLNFVNNFAALSAELTDELNDALKPAALSDTVREEVDELTGMLKDNLQKVVQHGKRADSIVKNMLLHSREGSGDHRPADINALVDESLNLAYHGARAEKPNFNVTLQRDFDPGAGMVEVFPQEITRVVLNLVANGFYAVAKRKNENGDSGFDPILSATTRDLGDTVEIRIRDNGTGIPPEVKDKMFNPFFTTKPAGEGTGLGLSMSHDIIVKQHGGTIDVETTPGQFTEFRIVLPRTSHPRNKNRGQT